MEAYASEKLADAVIIVSVHLNDNQRQAVTDVGKMWVLSGLRFVDEPRLLLLPIVRFSRFPCCQQLVSRT